MEIQGISQSVLDHVLASLTQVFLPTCDNDAEKATQTAMDALSDYEPHTNRELRLAAVTLAFSFGALEALARASGKDVPVSQSVRLRSSANALHKSAHNAERELLAVQEQEAALEAPQPPFFDARDRPATAPGAPPLSRQQRREQQRAAAKRREKEEQLMNQAIRMAREAMQRGRSALTSGLPIPAMVPPGTAGAGGHATSAVA